MPLNSDVVKQEAYELKLGQKVLNNYKIPPSQAIEKSEKKVYKKINDSDIVKEYLRVSRNNKCRVMTRSKAKVETAFDEVTQNFCNDFDRIFEKVGKKSVGNKNKSAKRNKYVNRRRSGKLAMAKPMKSFYKEGCKFGTKNVF